MLRTIRSTLPATLQMVFLVKQFLHKWVRFWPSLPWLAALSAVLGSLLVWYPLGGAHAAGNLTLAGPFLAISLMSAGMIAAAMAGRFRIGFLFALLIGAGFLMLARPLGLTPASNLLAAGFAVMVASVSFAARGLLFFRSSGRRGWWIAVFVVAGEAAILLTALAAPGTLPRWLLALLPAQWASSAIQTALAGAGAMAATSALAALAGTAATTLLVAALWPRRWPYLLMFTAWLGLSALVYYHPGPALPNAGHPTAAAWP